jgi:hypothetical protein
MKKKVITIKITTKKKLKRMRHELIHIGSRIQRGRVKL